MATNADRLRDLLGLLFEGRRIGPELLAEDAEWVNPDDAVEPGTRSGADGFNDAIESVFSTWDDVEFDVERVIEQGDAVLALGTLRGHVHGAGMEVGSPHAQLWTFRDGRATRMQWFNTHDDALEAAAFELVRSAFSAWNRGDVAAFADHTAEDVVWVEIEGRLEGGEGERHGRERLRQSLEALFEVWDTYHLEVDRIEPAGNRVLALVTEVACGRASGVEVRSAWGYLVTVESAAIARVEAYRDPREAIGAIRGRGFAAGRPGNECPNGADH